MSTEVVLSQESTSLVTEEGPSTDEPVVPERTLVSARVWDVIAAPLSSNVVKAALVPKAMQKGHKRRISVEVHKVRAVVRKPTPKTSKAKYIKDDKNKGEESVYYFEECVMREWKPPAMKSGTSMFNVVSGGSARSLAAPDMSVDNDEDASLIPGLALNSASFVPLRATAGWKVKYQIPLRSISLQKITKDSAVVLFAVDHCKNKKAREFTFGTRGDAEAFADMVKLQTSKQEERLGAKLKEVMKYVQKPIQPNETLDLLIEIVSGWNLPIADITSSDPMVACTINGMEVHRTQYIPKTLDPIWTLKTGSLFILTIQTKELFAGEGLYCLVKDYDMISNDEMGHFVVPGTLLYLANGEREVFKLQPPLGKTKDVPGFIAIRCRRATDYDKRFLQEYTASTKDKTQDATAIAQSSQGGKSSLQSIISKNSKVDKAGVKKYKIRPGPDPRRKLETEWMSKEEIQEECMKDSHHWLDSGSGKLGKIYLEILGCDGLPNLDTGGFLGNKTDAFVSVVFEDAIVRSDIIDDTLNPRWLPWMKRAFVFHMAHSSSQIFVGVFDSDMGPADDHDMIGKVSIDLSNMKKDTIYILKYDLFKSSNMSGRKPKGKIMLRLRIEVEDERKFLLSCLEPPPDVYVNVKTKKDFHVVKSTTEGKYDMEQYSMRVMNSYIEELLAYQHVLYYIEDAIVSVLMWRSHAHLTLLGKRVGLPIHSLIAFASFTTLVEKPHLLPSFFFLSITWFLVSVLQFRRRAPSPWLRCRGFGELTNMLILGKSLSPPDTIARNENAKEADALIAAWNKRISDSEERAKNAYEESVKAQAEYEKDMAEIGEVKTDLSSRSGGVNVDVFKPIFFPIQKNLAMVCRTLRSFRTVATWDEPYFAYWMTIVSGVMGIAFLFIPWFTILRWTARVVVWSIFGPWMKLVDAFYYSKLKPLSEDEVEKKKELERQQREEATSNAAMANRIKRENASKLRDIKKFMFGSYITKVPLLKVDRYRDVPLSQSQAVPYKPEPLPFAELAMQEAGYRRTRLPGQNLVGDMIPRVESVAFTDAPIGQPIANRQLLDARGPGVGAVGSSESTATVYVKLGGVLAAATIVTWVGVPLLSAATEKALSWL